MIHQLPTLHEVEAELCRRSYLYFFKKFWDTIVPDKLQMNWHIEVMCEELQQVGNRIKAEWIWRDANGNSLRIMNPGKVREDNPHDTLINIPPGSSKSTICTQLFPAWLWCIDPTIRVISGSYDLNLATRDALKTRDVVQSKEYRDLFPYVEMKADRNNKRDMETTYGGTRIVTSVGANVTGKHAHVLLVDDPLPPQKETKEGSTVSSDAEIAASSEWMKSKLSTRKVDKKITTTIMIMQRVHEDDPSGVWLKNTKKQVRHICIPARDSDLVRPVELRAKYINGLMDPVRLDYDAIAVLEADLGPYQAAGQLDQNPAPAEGGLVKKAWFSTITLEEFLQKGHAYKEAIWDVFVDGAYTEDKTNDPTACDTFTYIDGVLYWKDSEDFWLPFPEAIKQIRSHMLRNGSRYSTTRIEPKATGISLVQSMRYEDPELNIVELPAPDKDKITRLKGCVPFIYAQKVVLIRGGWNEHAINQVSRFPRASHDEHVDNLTAAIKWYHFGDGGSVMAWGSS